MSQDVPGVLTIPCICPPGAGGEPRHAQDTVELRETMPALGALACRTAIKLALDSDPDADADARWVLILSALREQYPLHGIVAWSVVDAEGKPLEATRATIRERLLANPAAIDALAAVTDAADDLYSEAVMRPLLDRGRTSSPPTPTSESTSAPTASEATPESTPPSLPSSTSTTPTGDTGTTGSPPDGDSSSSPSSGSA
jgi:hypothetical protein